MLAISRTSISAGQSGTKKIAAMIRAGRLGEQNV
jgi:hypothetical protein